jgi:hypothetical protein
VATVTAMPSAVITRKKRDHVSFIHLASAR